MNDPKKDDTKPHHPMLLFSVLAVLLVELVLLFVVLLIAALLALLAFVVFVGCSSMNRGCKMIIPLGTSPSWTNVLSKSEYDNSFGGNVVRII